MLIKNQESRIKNQEYPLLLKIKSLTVKTPLVRKPRSGFSLAEVLVVGVVGSVILAGSLQSLSVTVQSSQVIRSSLVEKDFVKSVGKIVSAPALCKANFKPATGKIEGTYGTGTITTLTDKVCKYDVTGCTDTSQNKEYPYSPLTTCKVASDCPEPSHTCTGGGSSTETKKCVGAISITSEDDTSTSNVKEYEFKNALEIISLELTADEDPAEPPKGADKIRTFSVFYKKLGMGQLTELIPGQCERKTGTVSAKTDGCYSHQCKIRYRLNDAGTAVLNCEALDCIEEGMYECSGGMVRNADDTACICPAHTPNWNGSECIDCEERDATKPWWNGAECDPCPPNLIFNRNNRKCEACSAPTPKPNRATNRCEACPTTTPPNPPKPWWNNGTCKSCPSDQPKYKSSTNECLPCHSFDSNTPKWHNGTCKSCVEVYPNPLKPVWDSGTCKSCAEVYPNPLKPVWDSGTCKSCSAPKTRWDGDSCQCPTTAPRWHNGTCRACPSNKIWQAGSCKCPTNKPRWHNGTCKSCPSDQPKYDRLNNRCFSCAVFRPSTPKWHNGTCKSCYAVNNNKPKWDSNIKDCVRCPNNKIYVHFTGRHQEHGNTGRISLNTSPTSTIKECITQCPANYPKYTIYRTGQIPVCLACYQYSNGYRYSHYNSRNNTCVTCPASSPKFNNGACIRCASNEPYYSHSTKSCKACPASSPRYNSRSNQCY